MHRPRVLQVLEATEGGTRTHLRDLVFGLLDAGWAVDVAVGTGRDPGFASDLERFSARGVGVLVGPLTRAISPRVDLRALEWLRCEIRDGRYELVHGHSSKGGFLARAAARLEGYRPVVYTPNAFRFLAPDAGLLERWLVTELERWAAAWCDAIIAVSESERDAAVAARIAPPEQFVVIPNGIDVEALRADADPGLGRAVLNVAEDQRVVLTVGRRVPQKGDTFLLDAWPAVVAAHPDAVLALVGDGPLLSALQRQAIRLGIADSVRFVPRQERIAPLYSAAHVYALPSLYEGCPYSLLEAMAFALPCVATAVVGSRDVLEDGVTGRLVPAANPPALAEAIAGLLADPATGAELGQAAAARVAERHTSAGMVSATVRLYESLLRRQRS